MDCLNKNINDKTDAQTSNARGNDDGYYGNACHRDFIDILDTRFDLRVLRQMELKYLDTQFQNSYMQRRSDKCARALFGDLDKLDKILVTFMKSYGVEKQQIMAFMENPQNTIGMNGHVMYAFNCVRLAVMRLADDYFTRRTVRWPDKVDEVNEYMLLHLDQCRLEYYAQEQQLKDEMWTRWRGYSGDICVAKRLYKKLRKYVRDMGDSYRDFLLCNWSLINKSGIHVVPYKVDAFDARLLSRIGAMSLLRDGYSRLAESNGSWYGLIKNSWWFASGRFKDFMIGETVDAGLSGLIIMESPKMSVAFMLLLKHMNRVCNIGKLVPVIIEYINKMAEYFSFDGLTKINRVTPEEHAGGASDVNDLAARSFEESFDITRFMDMMRKFLSDKGDSAIAIASVFGSIVFAAVTAALGMKAFRADQSGPLLKKLGNIGMSISGMKRGIYAFVEMGQAMNVMVKQCIAWIVGREQNNRLMAEILASDIEDEGDFQKINFMKTVEYMIDPANLFEIHNCAVKKAAMEKCDELANTLLRRNAETPLGLSRDSLVWLSYVRTELRRVRQGIFRYPSNKPKRFVPYWISLFGEKGTGKSELMTRMSKIMCNLLYKRGKYGYRHDAAGEIFSQNFTDKFMPGYNGQKILNVDDIFQDASSSSNETSSALKMISYISGTPYQPVQASIDEKGMPFDSQLIITTTNAPIPQRKEIVDQGALLSRVRQLVRVRWNNNVCDECIRNRGIVICRDCRKFNDEWFKRPVVFELCRYTNDYQGIETLATLSGKELITKCFIEFEEYYANQTELLNMAEMDDPLVAELLTSNPREGYDTPESVDLQARSFRNYYLASLAYEVFWGLKENSITDYFWNNPRDGWKAIMKGYEATKAVSMMHEDEHLVRLIDHFVEDENLHYFYQNGSTILLRTADMDYTPKQIEFVDLLNQSYLRGDVERCCMREFLLNFKDAFYMNIQAKANEAADEFRVCIEKWQNSIVCAVMGAVMGAIVTYVLMKAVRCFCNFEEECDIHAQSAKYQADSTRARPTRVFVGAGALKGRSGEMILNSTDGVSNDLVNSVLLTRGVVCRMNTFREHKAGFATVIRVAGPWILGNAHAFHGMQDGDIFEIELLTKTGMKVVQQVYDSDNYRVLKRDDGSDMDAAMYKCDAGMPMAKDITGHFLDKDVPFASTNAVSIHAIPTPCMTRNLIAQPSIRKMQYAGNDGEEYSTLNQYTVNTFNGDGESGNLLVAVNPVWHRKCIGILTASSASMRITFYQPISEAQLREVIDEEKYIEDCDEDDLRARCSAVEDENMHPTLGRNGLRYLGKLPSSEQIIMSKKSKLVPSLVHDETTLTQLPSVLSDMDKRMDPEYVGTSVLNRNMEGFDKQTGCISTAILAMAVAWLGTFYAVKHRIAGLPRRLLNNFEMVNGVGNYLKQLDMRTSPGYPYIHNRQNKRLKGKYEWFDETIEADGRKTYMAKQCLLDKVEHREKMAREGKRIPTYAYACLKDETRSIEKIKKGKTRVFLCMPMDYNMLIRKYFGSFIIMMHMRAAGQIAPCVGVDPMEGWNSLVMRLRTAGDNFEDFDYSGWDTLIHPSLMEAVADVANMWYNDGEENAMIRRVLMRELAHKNVIVKDRLFSATSGTTSGCAITAEGNCIVNELIMIMCWFILASEHDPELATFEEFLNNCQLGVYGDDIIKSVSNRAKWFNGNNIKPIIDNLGMTITSGNKDDKFGFKPLEELTFLKRSFKKDQFGGYVAPLQRDVIENITQWIHRCDTPAEATNVNIRTATRNYALWGSEEYNRFCRILNERIARAVEDGNIDLMPITETYKQAIEAVRSFEIIGE